MSIVTIHKAKTELSKLIARVEKGETFEIARRDKVVAILSPLKAADAPRKKLGRGAWAGKAVVHESFYEDLTPEELGLWEDAQIEPPR